MASSISRATFTKFKRAPFVGGGGGGGVPGSEIESFDFTKVNSSNSPGYINICTRAYTNDSLPKKFFFYFDKNKII